MEAAVPVSAVAPHGDPALGDDVDDGGGSRCDDADACPTPVDDEAELLAVMFDALSVGPVRTNAARTAAALRIGGLPCGLRLRLAVDLRTYPDASRPALTVEDGPNEAVADEFQRTLRDALASLDLGQPMLTLLVEHAVSAGTALDERLQAEAARRAEAAAEAAERKALQLQGTEDDGGKAREAELRKHGISRGEAISDRKSKFQAHVARVASVADVQRILAVVRSDHRIASAAHPAIYAYRFHDPKTGTVALDCDDDGESGASRKLTFLLEQHAVLGWVVVVTRWFGGILLGADRFKHISAVARQTLEQVDALP